MVSKGLKCAKGRSAGPVYSRDAGFGHDLVANLHLLALTMDKHAAGSQSDHFPGVRKGLTHCSLTVLVTATERAARANQKDRRGAGNLLVDAAPHPSCPPFC